MKKIITVAVFGALSVGSMLASEIVKFEKKVIQESRLQIPPS